MSASTNVAVSTGRAATQSVSASATCSSLRPALTVFEKVYELFFAVGAELLRTGDIVGEERENEVGEEGWLCIRAAAARPASEFRILVSITVWNRTGTAGRRKRSTTPCKPER